MDQTLSLPIPLHLILIICLYIIYFINAKYPTNLLWVTPCDTPITP